MSENNSTEPAISPIVPEKNTQPKAKIVTSKDLVACGQRLRDGHLVAFPTETVYGLGCHALDSEAVARVFEAKERPRTDPLIVHVTSTEDALQLWDQTSSTEHNREKESKERSRSEAALQTLTSQFWPGPLTLVAKAASHVPPILMANTGFVACRSPSHSLARALITEAKVPIAAPSANKFGHVSPTRAQHVYDDLQNEDVWIVDAPEVCDVGVESTVAKMTTELHENTGFRGVITVLRQGAVSAEDLEACLKAAGLVDHFTIQRMTEQVVKDHVATVAPGQTIRHYSPNIPSFIVPRSVFSQPLEKLDILSTTIVLDFGAQMKNMKDACLAYRDLSVSGDAAEGAQAVFEALRWAELVEGGSRILFPELTRKSNRSEGQQSLPQEALVLALKDRLTRAASGIVIDHL